jgi:hypothetical protein
MQLVRRVELAYVFVRLGSAELLASRHLHGEAVGVGKIDAVASAAWPQAGGAQLFYGVVGREISNRVAVVVQLRPLGAKQCEEKVAIRTHEQSIVIAAYDAQPEVLGVKVARARHVDDVQSDVVESGGLKRRLGGSGDCDALLCPLR